MRVAVLNLMKCSAGSIIASNGIAEFLSKKLNCNLIDRKELAYPAVYDVLFFVNGPMLYCDFRDEVKALCGLAKKVVWVSNDIAISMPGFVKQRPHALWAAFDNYQGVHEYRYVNWNALTYRPEEPGFVGNKGLCYYGAYRADREPYFRKYLSPGPYQVFISSSRSGEAEFRRINPRAAFFKATPLVPNLKSFQASIYIEDQKTHKVYCSPANRFYELVSAGTLILFDKACQRTFEQAGIHITPWVVDGPEDVAAKLKDWKHLREIQIQAMRRDYTAELDVQLARARASLGF